VSFDVDEEPLDAPPLARVNPRFMRDPDGRVHYSTLKRMAVSPKAYRHACLARKPQTSPMIIGSVTDRMVFGFGRWALYEGKVRSGREWEAFKAAQDADTAICIRSEYAAAKAAADAVLADPVAAALLKAPRAEYQRVMQWTAYGLPFAAGIAGVRGGVDLIAANTLADLKVTNDVEPYALCKHAHAMLWDRQLACYVDGARSLGLIVDRAALICVESSPPHDVVVLTFDEDDFERGRRSLVMWTEKLKACEASGQWPGHAQTAIEYEAPAWAEEE